jgi:hypothetical protein
VKKKNGTLRMCVDYRSLNKATVKNRYPLPNIDDLIDCLEGSTMFTKLDAISGFHQIRMHPNSIEKTAFRCPLGQFEYRCMPFGLTNCPSLFQEQMNRTLNGFLRQFAEVFIDDVCIHSQNEAEHETHVRQVLERLRRDKIYCNKNKCIFFKKEINFLGYNISEKGIRTDESKIKAVKDWETPKNTKEVKSFLGLASFYRKFVPHFSQIASPLYDLLKDKVKFQWEEQESKAFETLSYCKQTHLTLQLVPY